MQYWPSPSDEEGFKANTIEGGYAAWKEVEKKSTKGSLNE
jgi:hypothetical protein